jgi:lysine 2,3-aminomutase
MAQAHFLDSISISVKAHKLLKQLLGENRKLEKILRGSKNEVEALHGLRQWVLAELETNPSAPRYYRREDTGRETFEALGWSDFAAIRLLDYIDNAGREFPDLNLRGRVALSNPVRLLWLAVNRGTGGAKPEFFEDMLHLFRQLTGRSVRSRPTRQEVQTWMDRHPSGLDPRIVKLREENRDRIIQVLIDKIDSGELKRPPYEFEAGWSREQKVEAMLRWWDEPKFHLKFAVRTPELLNELLGNSLDPDRMKILGQAKDAGIPFFVNPYYLSLLHVRVPYYAIGADLAIRDYVIYSQQLVDEFGHIVAWEKEDQVEPGKPNAAGWLLPTAHNIHRRYPEVAILIPDSTGRACGGLCASCQRMYDFQRGNLNFDLEKLEPRESWPDKLARLMEYFENDSQLRDILITGGDALMSSDRVLEGILGAVYEMAARKKKANEARSNGSKYAELLRVRLGTRLPVYLPQRITPELVNVLTSFKARAAKLGVQQFVVQTHFVSPLEVTPEAREGIRRLLSAGWIVTNQLVFTTAASRRGHTAKLRRALNDVGVLPYYTFSVKGYIENYHAFATNARAVQEQLEEKSFGQIPSDYHEELRGFPSQPEAMVENIAALREKAAVPFVATDRNVINLPGVGKSLTYRVIGITRYGRRIIEFDHDASRRHSPIIDQLGRIVIIESKSISEYLGQIETLGEDREEYGNLYGYSIGETEPRMPLYEYPAYDFEVTDELTNLQL